MEKTRDTTHPITRGFDICDLLRGEDSEDEIRKKVLET
jgi:hypothetical protein